MGGGNFNQKIINIIYYLFKFSFIINYRIKLYKHIKLRLWEIISLIKRLKEYFITNLIN